MAPRIQRKVRLSRMDAAIDAMLPYGFAEQHVRKMVKLLLKEYGGNEGWPFIEEFSYKELIEAILRDLGVCDDVKAVENPSQDKSCTVDKPPAEPCNKASGAAAEPTCPEFVCNASLVNNVPGETSTKCARAILPDLNEEYHTRMDYSPEIGGIPVPSPMNGVHHYGWIDSNEEGEDEFVTLEPSYMVLGGRATLTGKIYEGSSNGKGKGKSRWDQRPDDL